MAVNEEGGDEFCSPLWGANLLPKFMAFMFNYEGGFLLIYIYICNIQIDYVRVRTLASMLIKRTM